MNDAPLCPYELLVKKLKVLMKRRCTLLPDLMPMDTTRFLGVILVMEDRGDADDRVISWSTFRFSCSCPPGIGNFLRRLLNGYFVQHFEV